MEVKLVDKLGYDEVLFISHIHINRFEGQTSYLKICPSN